MPTAHEDASPAGVPILDVDRIAAIHNAARRSGEAPAILVALITLVPCAPDAIAGCLIEEADWRRNVLRVPTARGHLVDIALGGHAADIARIALAGRTRGPLVLDPAGKPLEADAYTLDYAREILSSDERDPIRFDWDFGSIRESVFGEILDHDVPYVVAETLAGIAPAPPSLSPNALVAEQRAAGDWWALRLGLSVRLATDASTWFLGRIDRRDPPPRGADGR